MGTQFRAQVSTKITESNSCWIKGNDWMLGPLKTSIHLVVSETKPVEISEILERKGSKKGQTQKRWVFPTLSRMNSGTHCCKVEEDQLGNMDSFDDLKMHMCKLWKIWLTHFTKGSQSREVHSWTPSWEYGYLWKTWKPDSIYVYNFYYIK